MWTDPIVLVRRAVTFVVRRIINKYLPIVPSLRLMERVEDVEEVEEFTAVRGPEWAVSISITLSIDWSGGVNGSIKLKQAK